MAERRIFTGDRVAAFDYLGDARRLLMILKNSMQLGGLQQLQRTITYDDGTTVTVSSVYGQDSIIVNATPATEEIIRAQVADEAQIIGEADQMPTPEFLALNYTDTVSSTGSVMIAITRTPPAVAQPPAITVSGEILINNLTVPWIWKNDGSGMQKLGLGNYRRSMFTSVADDGSCVIGSVEYYNSTANPALTNTSTGATTPYGWTEGAAVWRNGTGSPNVTARNGVYMRAVRASDSANLRGISGAGNFSWDGHDGFSASVSYGGSTPVALGTTSLDGRVKVSGQMYNLDNTGWQAMGSIAGYSGSYNATAVVSIYRAPTQDAASTVVIYA